jgi:hypothetical protein
MKVYENIIIGNFLYGLGFAVRARRSSGLTTSVINLLQQSPADHLLADVLLEFPGTVRLIEFKENNNRSPKEKARHKVLCSGIGAENSRMQSISRTIHWYVELGLVGNLNMEGCIVPYLDAFPQTPRKDRLESFISQLADEVAHGRSTITPEEASTYLKWVMLMQGAGKLGTGGLLLTATPNGTLAYAPLVDISDLRLQHKEWIQLHQEHVTLNLKHQRKYEQKLEHNYSITHDI